MTMTKSGIKEAKPDPKTPTTDVFGWPNAKRWVGADTKSKTPPIVRTVIDDKDMQPINPLKQSLKARRRRGKGPAGMFRR